MQTYVLKIRRMISCCSRPYTIFFADFYYAVDFFNSVKYESLGCYKDERARALAIASMEGNDILLKDSYSLRKDAIQKCAVAAKLRGYPTFALQDGGMCVGSSIAHKTYHKYGKS